jgi:hypothetical protein
MKELSITDSAQVQFALCQYKDAVTLSSSKIRGLARRLWRNGDNLQLLPFSTTGVVHSGSALTVEPAGCYIGPLNIACPEDGAKKQSLPPKAGWRMQMGC